MDDNPNMDLESKVRMYRGSILRFGIVITAGVILLGVVAFRSATPDYIACTTRSVGSPATVSEEESLQDLSLTPVASLEQATSVVFMGDGGMIVTSKSGLVAIIDASGENQEILDLSVEVMSEGFEQGLLDVAISPDEDQLYFSFTDAEGGHLRVVEYRITEGALDLGSRRTVIVIDQPGSTHNGGGLVVDVHGMLWIGVGDGQAARLGDFEDWGNALAAQDPSNLYGSILRIDPSPGDELGYSIPPDNPFVQDTEARPEVWAFGLRNPWRFSIDADTGDLWIGDVGQHCWEEINLLEARDDSGAGSNLGWPALEGSHLYRAEVPEGHVLPVYEYGHGEDRERCSVVGGHVYRGDRIPELRGWYVFSDSCAGTLWALSLEEGIRIREIDVSVAFPVSLGVTSEGEIVVVSLQDGVYLLEPT